MPDAPALSPSTRLSVAFLEGIRRDVLARLESLPEAEAMRIPDGHRNNLHWQVGHVLHVQLAHWYTRRGLPLPVDLGWKAYFRDGKSPADYDAAAPAWPVLLEVYRTYSLDLAARYGSLLEQPLAAPFEYLGARFASVDDSLRLLLFHEGEHHVLVNRLLRGLGRG